MIEGNYRTSIINAIYKTKSHGINK